PCEGASRRNEMAAREQGDAARLRLGEPFDGREFEAAQPRKRDGAVEESLHPFLGGKPVHAPTEGLLVDLLRPARALFVSEAAPVRRQPLVGREPTRADQQVPGARRLSPSLRRGSEVARGG